MTGPDTPIGRHHMVSEQPGDDPAPEVERLHGELIAALSDDVPLYRVLWLLARGMNQWWCLRDLAEADAVDRATAGGLVVAPEDELIAFQLTDAGFARIRDWYIAIRHHRDDPGYREIWEAVANR